MIEPRSRGVLDHPLSRVMTALCGVTPSTSLRVSLQQFRRFRQDRIADRDAAAGDYFGIDPAIAVAEPALQRLRDGEIALCGVGIDVDGGAADNALDHLEPDIADRERVVEQVEFMPGRPALDIEVGAK